jgi:ATP-binding cassette subfamily B protein
MLYLAALLAQFVCGYGQTVLTGLLGQRVMRDLRMQIFAHLQRLPIAFFDRNPVGRLITRVTSDVEALNELFTAGVVAGLGDLFTLLAISVMMLVVDWRLALAAFVVIPFVVLTSRGFQVRVRDVYREIRTRIARINAFLQERLTGMRVVQLFGRERAEAERFDRLNAAHLDAHLRSVRVYALYFPMIEVLTSVALASLIVTAASRVTTTTLTIGTVAAFLQLVRRFFQPLQDLSEKFNILQGRWRRRSASSACSTRRPLRRPPGSRRRRTARGSPPDSNMQPAAPARVTSPAPIGPHCADGCRRRDVAFEDVWFAYDANDAERARRPGTRSPSGCCAG